MTKVNALYAIEYLQTKLSEVVDHEDLQQLNEVDIFVKLVYSIVCLNACIPTSSTNWRR